MSTVDLTLAEAARHERDHRAASYPAKLAALVAGSAEHAARTEAMTVDYQCWVAIAEWLETGRFFGFHGGADPQGEKAPWISWPQLETAAESALKSVGAKCDRLLTEGGSRPASVGADGQARSIDESYAEACARRARLTCIHRKVQLRRQLVDSINAELKGKTRVTLENIAA